jgi:DNA processing protein
MRSVDDSGARAVHAGGPGFPRILDEIPDPPAILFYRGDLESFASRPSVAVIGSRRASMYGLQAARSLASGIAACGVGIVSGLARGIDGEAHRGCLGAGGSTLAILGSGIDVIYPREHAALADEIAGQGAVVTEYPPGTGPEAFNFPERNRLISGFSLAVIVVEAGDRSGTMITVDSALEQGRDVFAVPGEITRAGSRGTNRLIREGALVATCPEDVLEALGVPTRRTAAEGGDSSGIGPEQDPVIGVLSGGPAHFDEVSRALGMNAAELQSRLLMLEISGRVIKRQGGFYSLP